MGRHIGLAILATASLAMAFAPLTPFNSRNVRSPASSTNLPSITTPVEESPCRNPTASFKDFTQDPGSAKILRDLELQDASGVRVRLGDRMGPQTSVVVVLRHLG